MYDQKPITDVGIDMDGVVYPFMSAFKKYCIDVLKETTFPEPLKWEFYEDWGISKQTFDTMMQTAPISHRLFASESPMENVALGWKLLRELGVRIHVITARPNTAWAQTADWLHDHELVPDHLHFTHNKTVLAYTSKGNQRLLTITTITNKRCKKLGYFQCYMTIRGIDNMMWIFVSIRC